METSSVSALAATLIADTLYDGSLTTPVRLTIAGGETTAFQAIIIPFWKDLKNIKVEFSDLIGAQGGSIPRDSFRWSRIGYVQLEQPPAWAKVTYKRTQEPDVLLPAKSFDATANTAVPLWVEVTVPPNTPAGTYKGRLTVTSDSSTIERDIEIEVFGFNLPAKNSLETDFWFIPSNLRKFYPQREYSISDFEKDSALLGHYRVSSFPIDMTLICPKVTIWAEPDGSFSFDWAEFDKYLDIALKNNSTALWASLSCNSGWTYYLNEANTQIKERASGKIKRVADYMQPTWDRLGESDWLSRLYGQSIFENPIYHDFLKRYYEHLKDKGVAEIAYFELFDEANQIHPEKRWPAMIRHHEFLRKIVPDLKLFNFGFDPTLTIEGHSSIGLIDAWAPHLFKLANENMLAALQKRRTENGEKFWFYTCTQKSLPEGSENFTPFQYYHQSYLALRIQPWMAWCYNADGFLAYSLTQYYPNSWSPNKQSLWPAPVWSDASRMGEGLLVYPGIDGEILPSIRLANLRQGMQDYEYFALLKKLTNSFSVEEKSVFGSKAIQALEMGPDLITSVYEWTKDGQVLENRRIQIGRVIDEILAFRRSANNQKSDE